MQTARCTIRKETQAFPEFDAPARDARKGGSADPQPTKALLDFWKFTFFVKNQQILSCFSSRTMLFCFHETCTRNANLTKCRNTHDNRNGEQYDRQKYNRSADSASSKVTGSYTGGACRKARCQSAQAVSRWETGVSHS